MTVVKQALLIVSFFLFSQLSYANNTASDTVNAVNQRILQSLRANKARFETSPDQLYRMVQNDMLPFVDFQSFSKLILGVHWKRATPEQRQRFTRTFQDMLMRTYAKSLLEYTNSELSIEREIPGAKPSYAKVYGQFSGSSGNTSSRVVFEMRRDGNTWKAYNITVNAFSLVKNFRTSFGREINQFGLDGLIQRLETNQTNQTNQIKQ